MPLPSTDPSPIAPLASPEWQRVVAPTLEAIDAEGWSALDSQRALWLNQVRPGMILDLFRASEAHASFGYETTMYEHCMRAGTRALQDGLDEGTVATILLHDIGYALSPPHHGELASLILEPFISEANAWMLRHHQSFIGHHSPTHPSYDPDRREPFRGHPHFEWTVRFCERYDQNSIAAAETVFPLEAFMPILGRVLGAPRP